MIAAPSNYGSTLSLAEAIRQVRTHTTSEKTKLVAFERPDRPYRTDRDDGPGPLRPGTFDFLGFTIHWGKGLDGKWLVQTRTSKSRFQRTLKAIATWCQMHRHHAIGDQQRALNQKLRGHYAYFGAWELRTPLGRVRTRRWNVAQVVTTSIA
ncbi:MAG: hypothetical protein IPM79_18230 [Polyangiaceae bacterium]|nr:hypothetical protein [Polyangiaceae bacterium]